ncbi:hypothetical protein HY480_00835, partial [Candidatus Uhrbacteria bacterium]|nr:hypothetical protein [Candidatus Uhrbacteria bacterium]
MGEEVSVTTMPQYDVILGGGGITGPAAFYALARYSDVRSVALLERRGGLAEVASGHEGNAQSLHDGSIETNFDLAKALAVRDAADLVAGFLDRHPGQGISVPTHKMVIGVGRREVALLRARYAAFVSYYP